VPVMGRTRRPGSGRIVLRGFFVLLVYIAGAERERGKGRRRVDQEPAFFLSFSSIFTITLP